jgi:hypothetical protein
MANQSWADGNDAVWSAGPPPGNFVVTNNGTQRGRAE